MLQNNIFLRLNKNRHENNSTKMPLEKGAMDK